MSNLLLHPTTDYQLKALLVSKPHAVLIVGPEGAGKFTVASEFYLEIFGSKPTDNTSNLVIIKPAESSIGIDEARQLKTFLKRKTTGQGVIRRMIIISDAQKMTNEAQNSILKILEEPPADTMIILTATDTSSLNGTIKSRCQHLRVLPVDLEAAKKYFSKFQYDEQLIKQNFYISGGRVGLLSGLLAGDNEHEFVLAIANAKTLLKKSVFERLVSVDEETKNKQSLIILLDGLERLAESGLRIAAAKNNPIVVKKFYNLCTKIHNAQNQINQNTNAKLVLTDLFLNM